MSQDMLGVSKPSWPTLVASGWMISTLGFALWLFGYFVSGTPSLIEWSAFLPHWAANTLPNLEAQCGVVLSLLGNGMVVGDCFRSVRLSPRG